MRRLLAGSLAAALGGAPAQAADWRLEPSVRQEVGYDDNIKLDEEGGEGGLVSRTNAALGVAAETPRLDLRLDTRLDYLAYALTDEDASWSVQLAGVAGYAVSPRTRVGLRGSFRRDTSIIDVLDSTGGRERTDDPRFTYAATPFFSHRLSYLDTLSGSASWVHRDVTEDEVNPDYTTVSGNLGWQRVVTARTSLGGNLYASRYESRERESLTLSPRLSVDYRYGEAVDLDLSLGPALYRTETEDRGSETNLSYTADGTLTARLTPTTTLAVTASHYLEPSGSSGELSQTGRVSASLRQRLAPRLSGTVAALAQRQTSVGEESTSQIAAGEDSDDRDFVQLSAGLSYELTERIDLGVNYRLRHERNSDTGNATSNAVFVSLSIALPEARW